ncbi:MAG: hypothetical protein IT306_23200 [Chloroflexi bacterium]|nr:hypothetical protein [Chloroflexota bacterium]
MKLPIRSLGLVAAGLLLGTALAPVAAQQQQSGADGQVAVRSDGAVYLIASGQRRWVATVVISDDEINAYPEGEPIFAGLAPMGSAQAAAKPSNAQPAANPQQQPPQSGAGASAKPTNTAAPQPTADPNISSDIPVEVDIDGSAKIERGEERRVDIKTRKDVTCDLTVRLPGGKEFSEDSKNADNAGKCRFTVEIPSDADEGEGFMIGTAREGGKVNKSELSFEVVKKK